MNKGGCQFGWHPSVSAFELSGKRKTENGKRKTENGKRKTENEPLHRGPVKFYMTSGPRTARDYITVPLPIRSGAERQCQNFGTVVQKAYRIHP